MIDGTTLVIVTGATLIALAVLIALYVRVMTRDESLAPDVDEVAIDYVGRHRVQRRSVTGGQERVHVRVHRDRVECVRVVDDNETLVAIG